MKRRDLKARIAELEDLALSHQRQAINCAIELNTERRTLAAMTTDRDLRKAEANRNAADLFAERAKNAELTDRIPLDPPRTIETSGVPGMWKLRHPNGDVSMPCVSSEWLTDHGYTVPVLPEPVPAWAEALGLTWDDIEAVAGWYANPNSPLRKLVEPCRDAVAAREEAQS